jgi:DNA-binding SARP family transcriptional activator/predicted negative regulator of RcsB-dependent stress response
VGVLGPVTAWLDDREVAAGQPRQRAVLAVLASRANRVVSRGELVDAVWGSHAPATSEGGIYTYVAGLRRLLDPDRKPRDSGTMVISSGAGYLLRLTPDGLDSEVFERQIVRARADRAEGYLPGAERRLSGALGLWRGAALSGVPGPFAEAERHRLTELRVTAAEEHADVLLALGRNEEAIPELTVLVAEHPLREHSRAMLMVALYRCGRQADALGAYRDAREVLALELGIEPGPELSRIHQRVLAMDPELSEPAGGETDAVPPSNGATRSNRTTAPNAATAPNGATTPPAGPGRAGPAQVPAQVPLEVAGFTGRHDELGWLRDLLPGDPPATVPVTLITGMAGVGKTALAIRFARQTAPGFADGQLYVNLRGFDPAAAPVDSADALRGFLEALGVAPGNVPESLEAQIGLFRSLTDGSRMLVVLDNAGSAEQVRPLLPASPGCMVVITSRNQLTGLVAAEGARPLPLDVLADAEARDLLRHRLGAELIDGSPAAVTDIVRLCDGLPLALNVTAARAATQPGLTLYALARELRASGAHVLDTGTEASTDIRAVFSWSYNKLPEATARVFRLLGAHPGPDVSAPAAASMAGLPLAETRRALAELTRASLVAEPVPGRYTYHDLLRGYATDLARETDGEAEAEAAERRLLDHYLRTADTAVHQMEPWVWRLSMPDPLPGVVPQTFRSYEEARSWLTVELTALLTAIAHAARRDADFDAYCWRLPVLLAVTLQIQGRLYDNLACQRVALAAAQRIGEPEALGHAHAQFGFAGMLFGDLTTAAENLGYALDAFTQCGDRAAMAIVHFKLTVLHEREGRHAEALVNARESLRLRRAFGHRAAIAHSENMVGWVYAQLGQYGDALRHCRRALDLATETGSRTLTAETLDSLGMVHLGLGDHQQALNWYQQALAASRALKYPEAMCSAFTGIGDAQLAAGDPQAARSAWQQAIAMEELPPASVEAVRERLTRLEEPVYAEPA